MPRLSRLEGNEFISRETGIIEKGWTTAILLFTYLLNVYMFIEQMKIVFGRLVRRISLTADRSANFEIPYVAGI